MRRMSILLGLALAAGCSSSSGGSSTSSAGSSTGTSSSSGSSGATSTTATSSSSSSSGSSTGGSSASSSGGGGSSSGSSGTSGSASMNPPRWTPVTVYAMRQYFPDGGLDDTIAGLHIFDAAVTGCVAFTRPQGITVHDFFVVFQTAGGGPYGPGLELGIYGASNMPTDPDAGHVAVYEESYLADGGLTANVGESGALHLTGATDGGLQGWFDVNLVTPGSYADAGATTVTFDALFCN